MGKFERVIGYEAVKEKLSMALDVMRNAEKYRRLGVSIPKGILLDGVPGVGKTLLAKEFIAESGRRSFMIRKNKPDGDFVDYIRETFREAAKSAPSIVFMDDMDKFANEDSGHRNAEEYVTIQACIDDVRDDDVFMIATTNSQRNLPDSLIRSGRFDWVFSLFVPEDADSEAIISHYLKDKKVADDIDPMELARFTRGYSCASLETVINDAGLYAGYEGRELISQSDLIQSCLRAFYGMQSDKESPSEAVQKRVAIHEAGHVTIAEILSPGSVDFASISCRKRCDSAGYTSCKPDADGYYLFKEMERLIMVSLGGKASTEVVLGETDVGANRDMHKAFDQTRDLIDRYTAYDFGSWAHGDETAQSVYENLDRATGLEVSRYYKKVKQLLIRNRSFLDAIIDRLYAKKTISYKDIKELSNLREPSYDKD